MSPQFLLGVARLFRRKAIHRSARNAAFASVVEGNLITEADQRAKLALVVQTAWEYWGAVWGAYR